MDDPKSVLNRTSIFAFRGHMDGERRKDPISAVHKDQKETCYNVKWPDNRY